LTYRTLAVHLAVASAVLQTEPGANPLAPREGWRAIPERLAASGDAAGAAGLLKGRTCSWRAAKGDGWIAFRYPDSLRGSTLLTYSASHPLEAVLETSLNSTDGRNGEWIPLDSSVSGPFLNKVDISPMRRAWARVRFKGSPGRIWNLGLYAPVSGARNDYWLVLGASIQNQSMRHARFNPMVTRRHPKADPVLFNLAVRGWSSSDLLGNLPALLEQHPHAGFALVHIGGNDVTSARPHDGGASVLERNLEAILDHLEGAGIVPILARLSYRRYRGEHPVPPEENGSLPYVTGIYDPLCARRTPDFYDARKGRCAPDFYSWFRERPGELAADGIHLNVRGEESWCREWARVAGDYVYGWPSRPQAAAEGPDRSRLESRGRAPVRFPLPDANRMLAWTLVIRDLAGRPIFSASHGGWGPPREPVWNLRDMEGRPARAGVYLFSLKQGSRRVSGTLLVLDRPR
jgi:lysophospholipase L1-like esterase